MTEIHSQPNIPSCRQENIREIAAIDLGSNSFHMIIARIVNGAVQILSRLKQKVQLAEGLNENEELSQEAIDRGVKCLAQFAERLQGFSSQDVIVVGTYTLRQAINNQVFLQQVRAVFPYDINIISGETEAKTIYAGVCHTQPETGRKLVIDIGGGSTEMIIGDDFDPIIAQSRHMGCVSFAKRFFPNGEITPEYFEKARQCALETIADLGETYRKLGWETVLGSSGTIKTVYQVISATMDPNGIITPKRLNRLIQQTLKAPHFNELKIIGLNPDRADVFVPGLAILRAVFEVCRINRMRYSDGALREGIIYSLERNFQVDDIRARTAAGLFRQFNIDQNHADRVATTIQQLCRQYHHWEANHQLQEMQEVLLWAAKFHEAGVVINHKNMNKHTAYILNNMELPGFDREQQRLLTTLVRFHIGTLSVNEIAKSGRYTKTDIIALIRILRLAVAFNRSRQATRPIKKILLKIDRSLKRWSLIFEAGYLKQNVLLQHELYKESQFLNEANMELALISEEE
ncbi:exopolyphosphatase [Rodentibacter caecimuris]|uniref:Exopolyphosphatase n=1 Tax=Rodentibacter caecimuris TaxID=1796644 RepID=A0ABX3KXT4_9PAST|nr:exopolyphosphatase [Rodentibacter heylii]